MNVDVKKTKDEHNANRRLKYASRDPQVAKQARLQRKKEIVNCMPPEILILQNKGF